LKNHSYPIKLLDIPLALEIIVSLKFHL